MKEGFLYFTDTHFTSLGLLIFFVWFSAMLIRVFRTPKDYYKTMSNLPLKEEG